MKRKSSKLRTAAELLAELERDPDFTRRAKDREQRSRALEERLRAEEESLVQELAGVGVEVNSAWDLVNTRRTYAQALPILMRHLSFPYHPRIREGIARALTIKNLPSDVGRALVQELWSSTREDEQEFRWALANALSSAAQPEHREDVERLITDERFASLRSILKLALKSLSEKKDRREKQ